MRWLQISVPGYDSDVLSYLVGVVGVEFELRASKLRLPHLNGWVLTVSVFKAQVESQPIDGSHL